MGKKKEILGDFSSNMCQGLLRELRNFEFRGCYIRLLFETGMRSNALAHAYLHLTGFSVTNDSRSIVSARSVRTHQLSKELKNATNGCQTDISGLLRFKHAFTHTGM